jgi:hypothetical protein
MIKTFVRFISKIGCIFGNRPNFSTCTPIAAGQMGQSQNSNFSFPPSSLPPKQSAVPACNFIQSVVGSLPDCAPPRPLWRAIWPCCGTKLGTQSSQLWFYNLDTTEVSSVCCERAIWKLRVFVSFPRSWGQLRQAICVGNLSSHNSNLPLREFRIEIRIWNATLELKLVVIASGVLRASIEWFPRVGRRNVQVAWLGWFIPGLGSCEEHNIGLWGKIFVCQLGLRRGFWKVASYNLLKYGIWNLKAQGLRPGCWSNLVS